MGAKFKQIMETAKSLGNGTAAATPTQSGTSTTTTSSGLGSALNANRAQRLADRAARKNDTGTTGQVPTPTPTPAPTPTPTPAPPAAAPKTIDQRIAEMTGGDSPLMEQARGLGMAFANQRGLANSSIAGGAIANEMLKVAAPIASQESQQEQQTALQKLQGDQAIDLQKQKATDDLTLTSKQGEIQTGIEKLKGQQAIDLQTLQGKQDMEKTQAVISSDEKKALMSAQVDLTSSYMSSLSQTLAVEKIPADQRAAVQRSLSAAIKGAQGVADQVYGTSLDWGTSIASVPATVATGATR